MDRTSFKLGEMRRQTGQRSQVGLSKLWEQIDGAIYDGERHGRSSVVLQHLRHAIYSLKTSPLNTFLTVISTALMLVLFGIFLVVVDSVQGFLKTQHSAVSLHVYLRPDVAKQSSEQVASMLKGLRGVSSVTFVDPDQALVRLKHTLGEDSGLTLGVQDDNPLPPSYEVLFAQDVAEELAHYATQIERFDGVEAVVFDRGFFESVGELLRVVARVAWIGIPFLFVIVAFIIASTVRLSLHSHREEIQIMKLVGARSRYIRAPFLLAAVIQGMLGSMLALGLLLGLGALSEDAWRHSKFLSLAGEVPFSMSTWVGALVLISGVVVGFVASHVTLRRFLSER